MTSWESYPDFLEKLGVPLLLRYIFIIFILRANLSLLIYRKLATMGTPIVEVSQTQTVHTAQTQTLLFMNSGQDALKKV